ncbi:MAG: formylglycine-generating enzyme family protein [Sedimenticola sp.]|nr:formylglycine-generating enzyme family protein [Sedimenticola sp.]
MSRQTKCVTQTMARPGFRPIIYALFIPLLLIMLIITIPAVQADGLQTAEYNEPEMLHIPGGTYRMGCTFEGCMAHDEPVHTVSVDPFLLSKYEITFEQYDRCVDAGGCQHRPADNGWGRGKNPVINVSWNDAQDFVRWLNKITGKKYVIPSEEEWEYAARAGTETRYYWGDQVGANRANCTGCLKAAVRKTFKVGSFPPNQYGLYDMHGNVYEITRNCWKDDYYDNPDASSDDTENCPLRVTRGGAWSSRPDVIVSSTRFNVASFQRYNVIGFRVAIAIAPHGP